MNLQLALDRVAIGLSLLCAIHCLILPLAMVLGILVIPFGLDSNAFHLWLLIAIIPTSLAALTMGCNKHKRYRVYFFGTVGLLILGFAGFFGHNVLGETGEKVLTIIGGLTLVFGHLSNYHLCREQECDCSTDTTNESSRKWTIS